MKTCLIHLSRLYAFVLSIPVNVTCNFDQQNYIQVTSNPIFKTYNRRIIILAVSEFNKSRWSHGGKLKNTYIFP